MPTGVRSRQSIEPPDAPARTGKRALFGWVLFDWATQPFYTLVVTFLFAPYFVNGFMADPARGSALWGYATGFAEVIADEGIYKKVPPSTWEDVVGELTNHFASGTVTQGFIRAIERCGKILAKHFPPGTADKNELPNHLIVLDAYGRP